MSAPESGADDRRPELLAPSAEREDLEHAIVERDDGHVECTLFPGDCDESEIVTRWMTAGQGSFVGLDERR